MTKEEAVVYIKNLKDGLVQRHAQGYLESKVIMNSSAVEALNMAIEALSKRDNAEPIPQWRGCMDGCLPYYDGRGER